MFTSKPRPLPFPLDRALNMTVLTPAGEEVEGMPAFPEDSDERITVLFDLSLNEFVALASAIDAGIDLAFAEEAQKVWWIWVRSVLVASFCEKLAQCISDGDEAVIAALATAMQTNPLLIEAIAAAVTAAGSGIPGEPLSPEQAATDTLPENVRDEFGDCVPDALWGACLYLVQSGNRAITDFFEVVENASNTIETAAIVAQTVPAAGPYANAAAEFADQIQENLTEGYAAAYTETYENQLACDIFCIASEGCELTPAMLVTVMENRLGYVDGTDNFGVLMGRVGTGVFVGSAIADTAFYIYFSALQFGQQFMDIVGFRPLTDMMGLGADLLASDNWQELCDCGWVSTLDFTVSDYGFVSTVGFTSGDGGSWVDGVGFVGAHAISSGNSFHMVQIELPIDSSHLTYMEAKFDIVNGLQESGTPLVLASNSATYVPYFESNTPSGDGNDLVISGTGNDAAATQLFIRVQSGFDAGSSADPGGTVVVKSAKFRGFGTKPSQLP